MEDVMKKLSDLEEENKKLKEALGPLASLAPHYPLKKTFGTRPYSGTLYQASSNGIPDGEITVEDIHRAADLLKS